MKYEIEFKPRSAKDLRAINVEDTKRILLKIRAMENDLAGDVMRLTDFEPQFRMRVGGYSFVQYRGWCGDYLPH